MAAENLAVIITGRGGELIREFQKIGAAAQKSGDETHSGWQKAGKGVAIAGAAIAGTALAIGAESVKMASEFEQSHAQLVVALNNSGSSYAANKDAIEKLSASSRKLGFTDTEVEGALATMTRGMGSASKAIGYMGIAQDLARAKNIDLGTASLAVTKAFEGQLRPLKQLGVDLPIAAGGALKVAKAHDALDKANVNLLTTIDKIHQGFIKGPHAITAYEAAVAKVKAAHDKLSTTQSAGAQILAGLGKMLDGSAATSADTFAGKQRMLKAEMDHLGVAIGEKLIPILTKMVDILMTKIIPAVQGVIKWFSQHKDVTIALGVVVGTFLVAAFLAWAGAAAVAAANTLIAMAPVILIIAAIAALVLAIMYLKDHWQQVWAAIQNAVTVAWNAIINFFKTLPGKILDTLKTIGALLGGLFQKALAFLAANLPGYFKTAAVWFIALPIVIIGWIAVLGARLVAWIYGAFTSLVAALPGAAMAFLNWYVRLPFVIIGFLAPFAGKFIGWVGKAFVALVVALPGIALGLISWFAGLPGQIIGAVGDASRWLYDVGGKIISGLLDGIKSAMGSVKSFLGSVGSAITSWKGPPSYDETILIDNGQRIMKGLRAGLARGMTDVRSQLRGFTADIGGSHTFALATNTGSGSLAGAASARGGGNTYVTVQVSGHVVGTTHDLGRVLSDALITYERKTGKRWSATVTP